MDSLKEQLTKLIASSKEIREKLDNLATRIGVLNIGEEAKELLPDTEAISEKIKILEADANALVESANGKIEELKDLTDETSKRVVKEAEEALAEAKKVLNNIKARVPIVDQVKEKATNATQSAQSGRGKFTGWISEQWDGLFVKEKRQEAGTRKTVARGAGFLATGGAVVGGAIWGVSKGRKKVKSWWSSLWNDEKKENTKNDWSAYDAKDIKDHLLIQFPDKKEEITKLKTKKKLVAYAEKNGFSPDDIEEEVSPAA